MVPDSLEYKVGGYTVNWFLVCPGCESAINNVTYILPIEYFGIDDEGHVLSKGLSHFKGMKKEISYLHSNRLLQQRMCKIGGR